MYVVSVKSSKLKLIVAAAAVLVFVILAVVYFAGKPHIKQAEPKSALDLCGQTAEDRAAFLSRFGWVTEEAEEKEITLPSPFDEVYASYNALQKQQGFDLLPYQGQRVKCWTLRVLNYPGYENDRAHIFAHLLVCDGAIIGGDIASVALDGFMQTFDGQSRMDSDFDQAVFPSVEETTLGDHA